MSFAVVWCGLGDKLDSTIDWCSTVCVVAVESTGAACYDSIESFCTLSYKV